MTTDFDYSDPPDVLLDKGYAESKTNIPGAENKAINSFNYVLELKDITVQTRARAFQTSWLFILQSRKLLCSN